MRIGIDARLWNETGVGRYIRNLVAELAKIDKENEYVLFLRQKEFENLKLPAKNWEKRPADIRWHTIEEQLRFPSILNKENLDLVHFPYFNVPILYRGPFVVTVHDLIISHFPTGKATTLPWPFYQLKRLGYKMALRHAVKNSRKIIAVSKTTKQEIVDHFGVNPGKVEVIHESGVLSVGNQALKHLSNKAINDSYLLYVGNAHPHKNLERLLEAFSSISNLKLILVGKEDFFYKRLKEKVKQMSLEDSVIFYGEANDNELTNLYQEAQALVMPSLMEGFGLPALEAMANKCLVLASDIPALHEVCGKAAIYFNPYDIKELAVKMEQVVNHSNDTYYHSLVKSGLERAKMFSWEKMAKETLKVYNSLKQ